MCGIIGSPYKEAFKHLFKQNQERGNFAYGVIKFCINNKVKVVKDTDFERDLKFEDDTVFYLGHLQSPTSTKREFSKETTHPFEYKGMYLAHNGVLSNFEKLKTKYNKHLPANTVNEVDSSIILPMVDKLGLKAALQELEGTFGCWLYDSNTSELFVFRFGSTIYTDDQNLSSKPIKNWQLLEEGVVYRFNFTKLKYEPIETFRTNNGFFI